MRRSARVTAFVVMSSVGTGCLLSFPQPNDATEGGDGGDAGGLDGGVPRMDVTIGMDSSHHVDADAGRAGEDQLVRSDAGMDAHRDTSTAHDVGVRDVGGDGAPIVPGYYWHLSDGFESGNLNHWQDPQGEMSFGALEIVDSGAYEGTHALHVTTLNTVDAGGSSAFAYVYRQWTSALPVVSSPEAGVLTSGTMAVRARIRVVTMATDTRELSLVQGGTNAMSSVLAGAGAEGADAAAWGVIQLLLGGGMGAYSGGDIEPSGAWHCVELVVNVSSAGTVSLYYDGTDVAAANGDTTVAGGWDTVSVGLTYSSGMGAADIYIDDVFVALYTDTKVQEYIGCSDPAGP